MSFYFITFRSVTFAQRAEAAVKRAGITCALQRTPRAMEERGCGYCLRLKESDVWPVVLLLRENEIPFRKIYCQEEDGRLEEMPL